MTMRSKCSYISKQRENPDHRTHQESGTKSQERVYFRERKEIPTQEVNERHDGTKPLN